MTVQPARPEKRRPAVMADVAQLAGVSHQTVSRVLHDSPHVSGETRERVLAAIRQLDYRPNSMARALVMGRTKTLGVVSFDTTLYGPASTLLGIERAAHDAGYGVSVSSLRSLNRGTVLAAIQQLRDQGVDGVAVIAPLRAGVDALRHVRSDFAVVAVEAGPDASIPVATRRPDARARAAATRTSSEPWPRDRLAFGRAARLEGSGRAHRGLELRARGGRSARSRAAPAAIGLRAPGTSSGKHCSQTPGPHRRVRGQRSDGARAPAPVARGRARGPSRPERGGVRRHPRGRVLHPRRSPPSAKISPSSAGAVCTSLLARIEGESSADARRGGARARRAELDRGPRDGRCERQPLRKRRWPGA